MTKTNTFDYDLIVIGSGAGGSAAANIVAAAGHKVAIVEVDIFGGASPNFSDIPTKAMLHAANLYDEAAHGNRFGLRVTTLGYNYPSVRAWKDLAIKRTGAAGDRRYYDNQGISTFAGYAHFLSPNEITVNRRHLSASYFLIASGAHQVVPSNIQGLDQINYLTPRTILNVIRPPKSLLIIGGGDTGIEFAQLMAAFGTKVSIVEQADNLLPHHDSDIGNLVEHVFTEQKGMTILTHSQVVSVEKDGLGKRVVYSRAGVEKSVHVDEILLATSWTPAVDIGLENAGVAYDNDGIKVNSYLQTSVRHTFAAGDVLGRSSHTHTALLESQIAAHNILHRSKIAPDYTATPEIIFTNPCIATVGLSEDDCVKFNIPHNQAVAPLNIISRSNTSDFRDGFGKIITDKKGVIIGGAVIAPHAGEIIHELVLAVKYHLTATQVAEAPHAFLSWSEIIRVAASKLG
jgi:dihydrolipoamide dehydrogenase